MRLSRFVVQLGCLVALSLLWAAQACKCSGPPTLQKAFQDADVVLQATILKKVNRTSFRVSYSAKIDRAWKGCSYFKGFETTTITTATSSAACGVFPLKPKTTYFLSGTYDEATKSVAIYSCLFQAPWSGLTPYQKARVPELSKKFSNCTCTADKCGPRLGMPNTRCPDGVTIAGPGPCTYNQMLDKCAWKIIQCPTCQKQSDCRKGQYCAAGVCRADGTCAQDVDCFNPDNQYFRIECVGSLQCKNSKCSIDCTKSCPDGSTLVNCFADPCSVTKCNESSVSCTSNYCGGCNAIFFNSSGYQVCKNHSS